MQALARVRQDAAQRLQMGNDTPDHLYLQIQIQTGSRYFSKTHLHVKNACLSLNVAWWCSWILCSSTARWLSRRQGIVPVSTIFHQSPPAGGHVTTMSPKLHQSFTNGHHFMFHDQTNEAGELMSWEGLYPGYKISKILRLTIIREHVQDHLLIFWRDD